MNINIHERSGLLGLLGLLPPKSNTPTNSPELLRLLGLLGLLESSFSALLAVSQSYTASSVPIAGLSGLAELS